MTDPYPVPVPCDKTGSDAIPRNALDPHGRGRFALGGPMDDERMVLAQITITKYLDDDN